MAVCENSAHIIALDILSGRAKVRDITNAFHDMYEQGVPKREDPEYVSAFVKALLQANLSPEHHKYFIQIIEAAPLCYYYAYAQALCANASKLQEKWNALIASAAQKGDKEIDNTLVEVLLETKPTEKSLHALENLTRGKHENYFKHITGTTWGVVEKQKAESRSKGIFGFFRGGADKAPKDRK